MKPHVLIIDDEQNIVLSLSLALRKEFEVDAALTAADGLAKLRAGTYELVPVSYTHLTRPTKREV